MDDYGLSIRGLAETAGVTERTARRWKQRGRIPEPYSTAIRTRLRTNATAAWDGWYFDKDSLISPEGVQYTPAQLRALSFDLRVIEEYRNEIARRRTEADFNRELTARVNDVREALNTLGRAADQLREFLPDNTVEVHHPGDVPLKKDDSLSSHTRRPSRYSDSMNSLAMTHPTPRSPRTLR